MARPLRIEFPGALYHVMSRGNERRRIVRDDADRQKWIEWLPQTVKTCGLLGASPFRLPRDGGGGRLGLRQRQRREPRDTPHRQRPGGVASDRGSYFRGTPMTPIHCSRPDPRRYSILQRLRGDGRDASYQKSKDRTGNKDARKQSKMGSGRE